jgi:broad specificity phosphatase PhoE
MGTLYLVRHGQASFGAADYDCLSPLGEKQSALLGAALGQRLPSLAAAWCGAMKRHRQTATACLGAMSASAQGRAPALQEAAGWNEYDHEALVVAHEPRYADKTALGADMAASVDPARSFQEMFAAAVARWVGGAHDGDYRETWSGFRARVAAALATAAAALGKRETALVFTSGGPIASVVGTLLGLPEERHLALAWPMANTAVTKLLVRGDGSVQLSSFNEHGHLERGDERLLTYR